MSEGYFSTFALLLLEWVFVLVEGPDSTYPRKHTYHVCGLINLLWKLYYVQGYSHVTYSGDHKYSICDHTHIVYWENMGHIHRPHIYIYTMINQFDNGLSQLILIVCKYCIKVI